MKTKCFALVGMIAVLFAASVASAQSTDPINFRTPFAFAIGDNLVPAGEYTVRVVSPTGTLSFRSADGNVSVLISSVPLQGTRTEASYRFVFHRYGLHYYMSEIWTPGYKTGRTIRPQARELELAKNEKPQHVTLFATPEGGF